jgi:hypothetical protein
MLDMFIVRAPVYRNGAAIVIGSSIKTTPKGNLSLFRGIGLRMETDHRRLLPVFSLPPESARQLPDLRE